MKNILSSFFLLISFSLIAQESADFGAAKFAPADGKKLLIIGQDLDAVGGLATHSDGYVDHITCHVPAGVTSYTSIPELNGLSTLANWGSGDIRAQAYLEDNTFDQSFIVIGLYLVNQLDGIINGTHDAAIETFALWVKGQNRPVFIRIGYEFEGSWNNYNPTKFKDAWKYIVHKFDELGVQNAAYVWQSAGLNYNNIIDWYPGDAYVNWVGYSYFDGNNMGQSIRIFANEHDKPIMIAEATPRIDIQAGNAETHWSSWYQPLFNSIHGNDRIKALAYINVDWDSQAMWQGQGWGDSRVQEVPYIKTQWETMVKTAPWMLASNSLFQDLNYSNWVTTSISTIPSKEVADEIIVSQSNGYFNITHKTNKNMSNIIIHDTNGKICYTNTTQTKEYIIAQNLLPKGPLFISIEINNNLLTKKAIHF